MPRAISPFPVPGIWYPGKNNVWNVASLHKSIILPLPIEERGAASCWISRSGIPASSVICSGPHLDRIVFWLLIAGPDLCDSSGYVMKTEFKRDCMQRHPFHLLRKTFYLVLIMYVPNHSSISYGSGIWRGGRGCCLCLVVFFFNHLSSLSIRSCFSCLKNNFFFSLVCKRCC